jgi:two-component system, cell cycle sensor histidine kinase and response regulator CckA
MTPILTLRRIAETGLCRTPVPKWKAILRGLLLVVGVGFAMGGYAAESAPMRVAFEWSAEPLSFQTKNGEMEGYAVDLIQAIGREMNFPVQVVNGPWTDILERFKAGDVHVLASVVYSQERDAFIDFSVPHLTMTGAIFVRRGDYSISSAADLANRRLAVQRDGFSHGYLKARGLEKKFVYVDTLQDGLIALNEGRCDAVTALRIAGNHIVQKLGLRNVVASDVELKGYSFNMHIGVHAGDAARLAVLNEGLARLHANDLYEQIHEKWIGPLNPRRLRFNDLRPMILPILVVVIIVVGTLWWQRRLLRRLADQTEKLSESEERLRHVLEGSEDGFWDWDMKTGRIERSERWASMLGYTLAEIGPSLEAGAMLVHPDDLASYKEWQKRLNTQANDRYDIEYRMRSKSGEWRWILDRGKVVARSSAGDPIRMAGTHTDITERKRTEAALIESQAMLKRSAQLLQQTQAAAHIGGWETDFHTGRVYWTEETYRIHETDSEHFFPTRDSIYGFYTPESRGRLKAAVEKAIQEGTPYSLELEIITAQQRQIHVLSTGMAEQENGRTVKLYGSFRDITLERMAEQERENLRLKMLEAQKLESLGVLAGGIAHDFNNLLTVILAHATFTRDAGGPGDERMAQIEVAARRAADLCRQMLAYAGKGRLVIEPIDLGSLVKDTSQLISVSVSKKARLELSLSDTLPLVDGDASQLRQVVMNLVINASEALREGSGDIRIATRVGRPRTNAGGLSHAFELPAGECVCLEVSDTGHGMNATTLARIFDPFFTTKFTGRGLGLAAVLGIVRTHHGALTVDSVPDGGSTFCLYLPVSKRAQRTLTNAPFPDRLAAWKASGTVLIADDEPFVLETTGALLRHRGFETVLAIDGNDAVRRFRETPQRFSAVLLDLTMPGLGGAEALRVIRSVNSSVPVLVMSGFSEQHVFDRVRGLGPVSVMRKPFTQAMLLTRVAEAVKA